jgi:hypothetical protein
MEKVKGSIRPSTTGKKLERDNTVTFYTNTTRQVKEYKAAAQDREQARIAQRRIEIERNSAKGIRAQESAEQAAAEAARVAAIKARMDDTEKNLEETALTSRLLLLTQRDPDFVVDQNAPHFFTSTLDKSAQQQVDEYNNEQVDIFLAQNPGYYACPQNVTIIDAYLERNGTDVIVSAQQLKWAYERLSSLGALVTAPVQPVAPTYRTWFNVEDYDFDSGKPDDIIAGFHWDTGELCSLTRRQLEGLPTDKFAKFCRKAMVPKPQRETLAKGDWGIDQATGVERFFTNREIDLMDSNTFKRTFKPQTQIRSLLVQPELVSDF